MLQASMLISRLVRSVVTLVKTRLFGYLHSSWVLPVLGTLGDLTCSRVEAGAIRLL